MRFALFAVLIFVVACSPQTTDTPDTNGRPVFCDKDNLICSDGSIVMRTGTNCEFICPKSNDDFCDYGTPKKRYFSRFSDMCDKMATECNAGETYFRDHCGCGCTIPYTPPDLSNSKVTNN